MDRPKEPELSRLYLHILDSDMVFVAWGDRTTSGTLTLTPEQAIDIGQIGHQAKIRAELKGEE